MAHGEGELRWFKAVFTTLGVVYALLASSMLARGVTALRDFGVPDVIVASPVMADFFSFFYQLMAAVGVLMVLFGHVTRGARLQMLVARVFCVLNVLAALRDLATSDSRFGSRLYHGDATLVFVYIDLAFAAAFGWLSLARSRRAAAEANPGDLTRQHDP